MTIGSLNLSMQQKHILFSFGGCFSFGVGCLGFFCVCLFVLILFFFFYEVHMLSQWNK